MNACTRQTALIYCEGQFGLNDGKTAEGLIRHSEVYTIVGVLDSMLSGKDSGEELGLEKNGIPIFKNLDEALAILTSVPQFYIYGKAPIDTHISSQERGLVLEAMNNGLNIVNGLHQIFSDDMEFSEEALRNNVEIIDIRKPPILEDLHIFSGEISSVDIPIVAVLGTDCACGKMTTARALNEALKNQGIKSVLVATGQTAIMQGSKYGVAIDALPSQFVIGEIENSVVQAFENENPDILLIEGQSSLGHEAFMSSTAILKGSDPDAIILQHPPGREYRVDFPEYEMPTIETELYLIEAVSEAEVIAITLSHENLDEKEVSKLASEYENQFNIPASDILEDGCQKIIDAIVDRFPELISSEI